MFGTCIKTHTDIYSMQRANISSLSVNALKYGFIINIAPMFKITPHIKAISMPRVVTVSALSCSFLPKYLAISTFMPTPMPIEKAHMRAVIGKESETAVRAFSLMWATKALSTKLYEYCINIEVIGGIDMVSISLGIGRTPILFSLLMYILLYINKKYFINNYTLTFKYIFVNMGKLVFENTFLQEKPTMFCHT